MYATISINDYGGLVICVRSNDGILIDSKESFDPSEALTWLDDKYPNISIKP